MSFAAIGEVLKLSRSNFLDKNKKRTFVPRGSWLEMNQPDGTSKIVGWDGQHIVDYEDKGKKLLLAEMDRATTFHVLSFSEMEEPKAAKGKKAA